MYRIQHGNTEAYVAAEYIEIGEATAITMEEYKEQQTTRTVVNAGNGEWSLLAAIIQCEAGGESHTGKVAVGADDDGIVQEMEDSRIRLQMWFTRVDSSHR